MKVTAIVAIALFGVLGCALADFGSYGYDSYGSGYGSSYGGGSSYGSIGSYGYGLPMYGGAAGGTDNSFRKYCWNFIYKEKTTFQKQKITKQNNKTVLLLTL